MFLQGLRVFRAALRVAYVVLAIGILMISVTFLQLPIFGLYDLWETPWVDAGGAILPYAVSCILMYVGMRKFATLLGVRSRARSSIFTVVVTIVFTLAVYVAAMYGVQYSTAGPYEGTEVYIAIVALVGCVTALAGILAHKIVGAIGEHYRDAMQWLTAMLFGIAFGAFHESFSTFFVNNGYAYNDWGIYLWPFVVTGAIALVAGYKFRLLADLPDSGTEDSKPSAGLTDNDYIDSIIQVSHLASRPQDVFSIMDGMRYVTAKYKGELGPEGRKELLEVYRKLEDYMVTKDSLRNLTREEVRRETTPAFRMLLQQEGTK